MDLARIAELLDPYLGPENRRPPTADLIHNISTYIDLLQRWNTRVNLTAIRNEEQIVTRHFGESLFAARHFFPGQRKIRVSHFWPVLPEVGISTETSRTPSSSFEVADIGSGAGFPGIPIKLWAPEIKLTLIESNHKKATFLREVTRALTLTDINIKSTRAESLTGTSFDLVTLRAVEHFESILPIAAALVRPVGCLALLIGQAQRSQAQSLLPAMDWSNPLPIPDSQSRILAIATRR